MIANRRLFSVLALMMLAEPVCSSFAQEAMTPQEFCAGLPPLAQENCNAAGELLSAPPTEEHLTVFLRASDGALSVEYRFSGEGASDDHSVECSAENVITLPAGEVVRLLFTSSDAIYSFDVPGYAGPVDLVPGRVNELLVKSPSQPGEIDGTLQTDSEDTKRAVRLRFVADKQAFNPQDGRRVATGCPR
ncbi:hypothetical protein [Afifella marina]|uniref:Cytochrome C oxidase subunit II, substrate-binding n=1 Tax=Afifella marina DSM 2698 TaxID=1120955 RepID=A0A1G5MVP2_AFIMA|nr:hypothetical protein [Afifella marina]MBK1622062.1 hypothetical protein [Afifella marina DSM 2698]MBK1627855.1 hypothetical protein [Afifella marina]MBK5918080.1 hypothetical protein [Afifella marina]RAI19854.1 hypothetical protein CH311_11120 [Afifella marina DSM 2698]SCZ29132.1 Cytochrome C oxidase subunit II, substrate-binding [Afifella marina DSM 2698]